MLQEPQLDWQEQLTCEGGSARLSWRNVHYNPDAVNPHDDPRWSGDPERAAYLWALKRAHHPAQRCNVWLREPLGEGQFMFVIMAGMNWGHIEDGDWDEIEEYLREELADHVSALTFFAVCR